ncbi:MAG: EAL domain-containing protein [Aquidulcibacter sp.]|uniref:putative bifunctional diguanylate cyclase/phosphodiesterase n=1 Tax=Aquidulcibacter sp. TaxID=2052990 RepID=UPI0022C957C5|nr:EAL domain-containing protein [Aquidulcibacter sp.]MCE2890956.1 EAL domain-containing protein [Hyphomonadaceae bacterium]MCZ8206885.1 EAL domain-containing protein [Aquidulcibacter sp.]
MKDLLENILKTLAGKLTLAFLGLMSLVMLGMIVILSFTIGSGRALAFAIGGSTLSLVLATAAFYAFVNRITDPLRDLTEFAQQTNLKRLGVRLDIRSGDELEILARALNRMMQRLDASMKRIQQLAFVDTITELPNRDRFRQETDEAAKSNAANNLVGAVISIDVDKFIRVQETLGQIAGEELLGLVAERLSAAVRASDRIVRLQTCIARPALLARTGISEFAVLIPDIDDPTQAGRFAQLVAAGLRQHFELGGHRIVLGACAGIAIFPQDGETGEEVLRSADLALSHARNGGRNRSVFFTRKMNQRALEKLVLENEIRAGIEQGQFMAYFQPKVDLGTGRIHGCEALVRWNHPTQGMVSPTKFITAAEETGLIAPLGDYIMRDAAKKAAAWLRRGIALRVAVNVSAMQFNDDNFTAKVQSILAETGLPASLFELEITESIAMSNPDRVIRLLEPLRNKGVRIAIDDFGTGHSNLAALTRMPFDVFKIDQSFIRALGKDRNAPTMIETIIAMAGGLNYETVAEGVETQEQAAFLKKRGATLGQGYLFGSPMSADQFEAHARNWAARADGLSPAPSIEGLRRTS